MKLMVIIFINALYTKKYNFFQKNIHNPLQIPKLYAIIYKSSEA